MGYADVLAGLAGPKAAQPAGKMTTQPVPKGSGNEGGGGSGIDPRTGLPFQFSPNGSGGEGIWIKDGTNMSGADPTTGLGGYSGVDGGAAPIANNLAQLLSQTDWQKSVGFNPAGTTPYGAAEAPTGSGENFQGLDSTGSLEAFMQAQGLSIGSLTGESVGQNSILQAFNQSNQAVGDQVTLKQNDDAFGIGVLAFGGVAGAAAAGVGGAAEVGGMSLAEGAYPTAITGVEGLGGAEGLAGASSLETFEAPTAIAGDAAAAPGATAVNSTLADAAVGSPGYGAGGVGTTGGGSVADLSSAIYSDTAPVSGAGVGGPGTSISSSGAVGTSGEVMGAGGGAPAGGSGLFGTGVSGSQLGQLASSLYGIYQGGQIKSSAGAADPFAKYRGEYGAELEALMKDPSSVTKLPGYQASQQAAEQALTRNLASQGLTGSGVAAEALAKEGAQFEDKYYQETIATLSGLAGSGINNAGVSLAGQAAGDNTINQSINNLMKIWGATGGSGGGGSDWGSLLSSFFGS